jgi:HSP20 family molecular chaperone IbpA
MHRTERYSGEVTRTMIFPENADLERLEAKYEDGVLWIKIPKNPNVPEDAPRSVLVN